MKNISEHDYKMYRNIFCGLSALVLGAIIFWIIYSFNPFTIVFYKNECFFHGKLHVYCPGCGGTRALEAFLKLHLWESLKSNPFVILASLFSISFYVQCFYTFVIRRDGNLYYINNYAIAIVLAIIMIVYVVARDVLLVTGIYDIVGDLSIYY